MSGTYPESAPDLGRHMQFLGRIYTFLGWLGLAGSALLLFSLLSPEAMTVNGTPPGLFGLSWAFSIFLLVCWSILLLNFSKDLTGRRRWSTGVGGFCIGILNLLSVPFGTAVGTYTLWILFWYRRVRR